MMPKSPPSMEMAPQSISFIGDEDSVDLSSAPLKVQQLFSHQSVGGGCVPQRNNNGGGGNLEASLGKLNISSGSRTYRIPSPTRPVLNSKSFQVTEEEFSSYQKLKQFNSYPNLVYRIRTLMRKRRRS